MSSYRINCVLLALTGALRLEGRVLDRIGEAIERDPIRPERCSGDLDYSRDALLQYAQPGPTGVPIDRDSAPVWHGNIWSGPKPTFWLRAPGAPAPETARRLFAVAEEVASAMQPDIGWAHILRMPGLPLADEEATTQWEMDRGVGCAPVDYRLLGPGGLGMRTFLGPLVIAQLGRARLDALPAPVEVTDLPWGGVMIDLASAPWAADPAVVRASWRRCHEVLAPAGFFTRIAVRPSGAVTRVHPETPGRNLGGRVPEPQRRMTLEEMRQRSRDRADRKPR